ncbi:MAG: HAMP domain-containing sensor histidine kinase [Sporichthyaceae bacterium]
MRQTDHADDVPFAGVDRASPDIDSRVDVIVRSADLRPVADAMAAQRTRILDRWLGVASRQPFHQERPDHAVSDHIPELFDAVVAILRRPDEGVEAPTAPLDDDAVAAAATAHAQARFEQGLGPVAVVTEFRILRQEIGRAMTAELAAEVDTADAVAGITLIGDALDGAAAVGLTALSDRIETVRESFLATTLHDVRQPITLVEGSLHLADRWLTETTPDAERVAEVVHDALLATIELVIMIDTLSDASRVAMGALNADPEPVGLEHVVREAIDALGPDGRERVRLKVDEAVGGHLIGLWDPSLLRRLVANLVGNALKYSPAETPVEVTVGAGNGPTARLTVIDRGIGMAADELDRVFERFARTDRARQSGAAGLGLGLYACRGIVSAHGGTIVVTSDGPDRGTTVLVTLPTMDEPLDD